MNNNKGQTSVEYLLLILVVVAMIFSSIGHVRDFFLRGINDCDSGKGGLACSLVSYLQGPGGSRPFEYFQIRR